MNLLNTGFSKFTNSELEAVATRVLSRLTGNATFKEVNPPLAILEADLHRYRNALAMLKGEARDQSVASARAKLSTSLEKMARSCELITRDKGELATTGFKLRKEPTRTNGPVDAPSNVRLKPGGTKGQLRLLCEAVTRAKAYEVQYTQDLHNGTWTNAGIFPSTRGVTIEGLQRGKDYWARVRAIGPTGAGAWSKAASTMVT